MTLLAAEIKNLEFENLHNFGLLQKEIQHVQMSTDDGNSFNPYHLLVFNEHIVALLMQSG